MDNVQGTVLRDYAHGLINWVQTDIFNTSFSEAVVLVCLKIFVIIPKPKTATMKSRNALSYSGSHPESHEIFEWLVMTHKEQH